MDTLQYLSFDKKAWSNYLLDNKNLFLNPLKFPYICFNLVINKKYDNLEIFFKFIYESTKHSIVSFSYINHLSNILRHDFNMEIGVRLKKILVEEIDIEFFQILISNLLIMYDTFDAMLDYFHEKDKIELYTIFINEVLNNNSINYETCFKCESPIFISYYNKTLTQQLMIKKGENFNKKKSQRK